MTFGRWVRGAWAAVLAVTTFAATLATPARAGDGDPRVTFDDPLLLGQPYYGLIESHLEAALADWARHFTAQASFEILVVISPDGRGVSAASATSGFVEFDERGPVFEQGMAFELRTGVDPNGASPDIVIEIDPGYLQHELWFDPDPLSRTAPVEAGRTDAVSVFIHELGHALAFNGWHEAQTFADGAISTWDRLVTHEADAAYFLGPRAMSLYGAAVPVTWGFDYHIGNTSGQGMDLVGDVMNGTLIAEGRRYEVSALDLAMLRDMGVAVSPAPEPSTFALLLAGLGAAALVRRRSTRSAEPAPAREAPCG